MTHVATLSRGVFTISLDFELIWGTMDLRGPAGFAAQCLVERDIVLDRLLSIFAEFDISATWLVVGHLFLDRCERVGGRKHPEIVRPQHAWLRDDWFAHDPDGAERDAPLFLGRSLVEKIRACPVPQEIGSHSFSHVIFGDPGCSEATARSEIAASVRAARELGVQLRSFSYPRNVVGFPKVLAEHGFACYRGPDPVWYHEPYVPGPLRRIGHLASVLAVTTPPTVMPRRTEDGLIDLPGSMVYFPAHGVRRFIPMRTRVGRALKGLDAAVRTHRVFHLWMHPTNVADDVDGMLGGFRDIMRHAAALRDAGRLDILPMAAVAATASGNVA